MQNKAKVKHAKININIFVAMRYEIMDLWLFRQTKPKTNPIKANSKPIKANTNPIQTQFVERAKMNAFAWIKESYDCFNNATRGIYHPK